MVSKNDSILERYMKVYVAAASDAADEVGIGHVCMDTGIRPMTKVMKMVGYARTGKLVRSPATKPYDEAQLDRFM
ncbi:MAG: hypothetical protein ACW99V_08605, partial [Candidatus Thorarchaeota archaeon]